MNDYWCIPPKENAEFVAAMEDILDIYEKPYDPSLPVVYMDEKPYQCLSETRAPSLCAPMITRRLIRNMLGKGRAVFLFSQSHYAAGAATMYGKHGQHLIG